MHRRLHLVHGPTPLARSAALSEMLGVDLWIKRDDMTGGAEAGNKLRKLEWLLAAAVEKKADVVLTCGGIQSNHARATAIACATLGMKAHLYLRVTEGAPGDPNVITPKAELPRVGNVALDRLVGAEIHYVTPQEYAQRGAVLESAALEVERSGKRAYVIPEGGSNGLGALGYVEAMREVRGQLDLGLGGGRAAFDEVVHACGSGGTAAGVALGAARFDVAKRARAVAVCDDAAYFGKAVDRIVGEAKGWDPELTARAPLVIDEHARGPAYAVSSPEQRELIGRVARGSGLLLDPVYTGKAMHGLKLAIDRGDVKKGARVLFLHTGGLPGLLAQADEILDDAERV